MKKLLAIIILSLSIFGGYNSVLANNLTCSDDKNGEVINIFYNQDRIETLDKTFTNVLIFGNGVSAEYFKWKTSFLGFRKLLDESWKINLEFSKPKSTSIIKYKYENGEFKQLSESSYLCQ